MIKKERAQKQLSFRKVASGGIRLFVSRVKSTHWPKRYLLIAYLFYAGIAIAIKHIGHIKITMYVPDYIIGSWVIWFFSK